MKEPIPNINEGKMYTVAAAAELCGLAQWTVRKNAEQGKLRAYKDGGQWRIRGADLRKWMAGRSHGKQQSGFRRPDTEREDLPDGYCWECRFCCLSAVGQPVCSALGDFFKGSAAEHSCEGCSFVKRERKDRNG